LVGRIDESELGLNMKILQNWFRSELGHCVQSSSTSEILRIIPRTYFSVALDLGPGIGEWFQELDLGYVLQVNPDSKRVSPSTVIGQWEKLPLGRNSTDLIVLQYTLDFSHDPQKVLRESVEALNPEGYIVICGFNPLGLWGISRILLRRGGRMPWSARFLRPSRIHGWLNTLGAQTVRGSFFFYRPPINSTSLLRRLDGLEKMGARWWPILSGAYLMIAQKKNVMARPAGGSRGMARGRIVGVASCDARLFY